MKNFLLNIRQFKALTVSFVCMSGLFATLPMTPALAKPAALMLGVTATPVITDFTPTKAINDFIDIEGSNLTGAYEVQFGSVTTTTNITVVSDNLITVKVPTGATIGNLTVTTPGGSATTTTAFTPFVTWNGGSGSWHVASNWGNNEVPNQSTNVIINSGFPTVSAGAACNNLTIASGVTLTLNSTADLSVSGLFVNSGTYTHNSGNLTVTGVFSNQGGFTHTGGSITFAAPSGDQYLPALTYYNLVISGGGDKYLQGNTTVTSNLHFTGSNLKTVTPANILTLNGTISGEDNNHSYRGKLVKTRSVSGVVTDNFGNIGIGFTNTGGGNWGAVTATRVTGQAITSEYGTKSINRYWTITPTNPNINSNVSLTLTWLASELNGLAFSNGQAQAWRKEATDTKWTAVDNMQAIVSNNNERSITVNTNTFSTWAITDMMNPLPVTMTYFKGKATEAGSQLNWATASEKNSAAFEIERSTNGEDFETIGSVKAAGNSSQALQYTFTDRNATGKTNYYRLRQVDLDGTFAYSAIVTIANNNKVADLTAVAYPNPFSESLNLKLNAPVAKAEVALKTIEGREVYRQVINQAAATNLSLSNLPKLKPGFYLLNVVVDGKTTVLKVAQQ